jgi:DNA-binding MltR family transcriptional regulator
MPSKLDKNKSEKSDQWQWDFLKEQFGQESDRAAVILSASILDESLGTLLKSYLVPNPSSQDSLFDNATSPLSNFSSKIDMAYRIGLVSGKMARDIHIVRKIRNSFAHDVYGCSFSNGSVKSRIKELENSASKEFIDDFEEIRRKRSDNLYDGERGLFLILVGAMIWIISELIKEIKEIEESKIEWLYTYKSKKNKL